MYSYSLRGERSVDRIPVKGSIFLVRPYRCWGPPSFQHNGYRLFPAAKRPKRGANHPVYGLEQHLRLFSFCTGMSWGEFYLTFYDTGKQHIFTASSFSSSWIASYERCLQSPRNSNLPVGSESNGRSCPVEWGRSRKRLDSLGSEVLLPEHFVINYYED